MRIRLIAATVVVAAGAFAALVVTGPANADSSVKNDAGRYNVRFSYIRR
jgi:hypothetical protein